MRGGATVAVGLAGAVLIGCSDDDDEPGTGTPAASPGTSTPPPTGATTTATPSGDESAASGTMRWGMLADITALEPHIFIANHNDTIFMCWDRLTGYDENLEPHGRLAESFEVNDDFTELVLHLREGVTFHSGEEMVAEDVVFNMDRGADPNTGFGQLAPLIGWFDSYEATDAQTVVLRSAVPRPAMFDMLEYLNIADPRTIESLEPTTIGGTGPFVFEEWRPGDQLRMSRNANYWVPDRPRLEGLQYSLGLDAQTMVVQLESGALDIVQTPPFRDLARWRDSDDYQALVHGSSGAYYVAGFNCSREPFSDPRVRQALNWSLDRGRFAETLLLGTVEPYSLPWPQASIAYDAEKANHYSFDLEEARQLLDAAGVESLDFEIILTPNLPEAVEFASVVQEDVAQLGLNLEVGVQEVASWVEAVNAQPPSYNGMYLANSGISNTGSPITLFTLGRAVWGYEGVNNTWYQSDAYTAAVEALSVEPDTDRQREICGEINDLILEDSWIALLAPAPPRLGMASNVRDVESTVVLEGFDQTNAWLEE